LSGVLKNGRELSAIKVRSASKLPASLRRLKGEESAAIPLPKWGEATELEIWAGAWFFREEVPV
jgi:hypothetical protein